jgi:hypothetical protein
MAEQFSVGDRIRYTRGARWSVRSQEGVILRIYTAHSQTMLDVDFGTEVYPCWVENVDPVYEDVTDAIVSVRPSSGP